MAGLRHTLMTGPATGCKESIQEKLFSRLLKKQAFLILEERNLGVSEQVVVQLAQATGRSKEVHIKKMSETSPAEVAQLINNGEIVVIKYSLESKAHFLHEVFSMLTTVKHPPLSVFLGYLSPENISYTKPLFQQTVSWNFLGLIAVTSGLDKPDFMELMDLSGIVMNHRKLPSEKVGE